MKYIFKFNNIKNKNYTSWIDNNTIRMFYIILLQLFYHDFLNNVRMVSVSGTCIQLPTTCLLLSI